MKLVRAYPPRASSGALGMIVVSGAVCRLAVTRLPRPHASCQERVVQNGWPTSGASGCFRGHGAGSLSPEGATVSSRGREPTGVLGTPCESPEGAAVSSRGREPTGVLGTPCESPGGAAESLVLGQSLFRPSGAPLAGVSPFPRAHALGY